MRPFDELGFLTTLGREFCIAIHNVPGIDDPSGQDCYSVIAEYLNRSVTPEILQSFDDGKLLDLSQAFNRYFEISGITPEHMRNAIASVLSHWPS